ncbi:MAG TPA: DUF6152 family protein [Steroidobacteraceae bacterium]|nr:DUF6152 family protein [Steroidobacteraceae bacterium]
MRTKLFVMAGACVASALLGGAVALAHHAFAAEFDANKPVNLRGPVTRVEWINPHAWIHIDSKNADGTTTAWMVEGGTPNTLLRRGITKDSLQIGTEIVVRGYQSKDALCKPKCRANGRDVTFPDGRKLFMGSSGTGAPKDGSDATEK